TTISAEDADAWNDLPEGIDLVRRKVRHILPRDGPRGEVDLRVAQDRRHRSGGELVLPFEVPQVAAFDAEASERHGDACVRTRLAAQIEVARSEPGRDRDVGALPARKADEVEARLD